MNDEDTLSTVLSVLAIILSLVALIVTVFDIASRR